MTRITHHVRSVHGLDLSVVVPLYNEQESVRQLHGAIAQAISGLGLAYEIIFVDDGSRDRTFSIAESIARDDPQLRVVKFRRNYGQTPAMAAGIDCSVGRVVVTMDGDLQNDPEDIPELVKKIDEGFDIVVGWRHKRQDKLITRKVPSVIANWLIGKVTGVPIKDNGCSLKAFRSEAIKNVPLYSEMHRFIPAMASIAGPRIAQIKVRHHARVYGESKYGLSRIYKVLLDLVTIKTITSFATKPLRWFTLLALPFLVASIIMISLAFVSALLGETMSIPIAGSGLIFFMLAAYLIVGGAVGELIHKTGDYDAARYPLTNSMVANETKSSEDYSIDKQAELT